MPYIGNTAANRFVASKAASVFSGDGSTTAFTLDHGVGSDEDILVSVDGVIQEPSVAYSVSGTTLTFSSAPSSNSGNNIFVYYLFRTVGTVSHPSSNALTATNATLTGNLDVTGTTTLSTKLATTNLGAGAVLQVVSGSTSTQVNVASTTLTDTGLTASITPSSTSSKILIIISQSIGSDRDTTEGSVGLQLLRGSTNIQSQTYVAFIEAGGASAVKSIGPWAITHLDSPNTTSSTTYKTQGNINATSSNGTARFQWGSGVSHITLMEISA